jgi:hypothetical protein
MTCAIEGSDGDALATPGGGVRSCGVVVRPPSDSRIPNKKPATDFSVRAFNFHDDGVMLVICPTCQTVFERSTNCGKFDETVSIN